MQTIVSLVSVGLGVALIPASCATWAARRGLQVAARAQSDDRSGAGMARRRHPSTTLRFLDTVGRTLQESTPDNQPSPCAGAVVLADETATLALGGALAHGLQPALRISDGDLGAGETTLVRGLLRAGLSWTREGDLHTG